eukprot:3813458-Rhodomonas_salina.4
MPGEWVCQWETPFLQSGLPFPEDVTQGLETPDGLAENHASTTVAIIECALQMDNDADAVEAKVKAKEAKYAPARSHLVHSLRAARGQVWDVLHLFIVVGWKTSLNEKLWHDNLAILGIPGDRHKHIIQHCVGAALNAFSSMTDEHMGAS